MFAQPVDPSAIDLDSINNRLSELAKNKLSKPYEKQKPSLHRELLSVMVSFSHPSIKQYLKSVKEEQAKARSRPKKAIPIFLGKLQKK